VARGYHRGTVVDRRCATASFDKPCISSEVSGSLEPFGTIDSKGMFDTTKRYSRYSRLSLWRDYGYHFFVPWID
jgi:hypothetical protein